jgi:hypothetical protein
MNKIKPFQQFIKESTGKSIGDRFEELVDESDDLGIAIKIDNRNREGDISELGTIKAKLQEEYPNVFKISCGSSRIYDADYYKVSMMSYNTEKDLEDGDPTDYKEVKVSIPPDEDDFNPPGYGDRW